MTRATPGPKSGSILASDILRFPFRLLFCAEKSSRFITLNMAEWELFRQVQVFGPVLFVPNPRPSQRGRRSL